MIHVLHPPPQPSQAAVRIYASRIKASAATLFCLIVLASSFWLLLDPAHPDVTSNPWLYIQPWKTIVSLACIVLCGFMVISFLYHAVTPNPLLQLNSSGLRYQRYPRKRIEIAWHDIEAVVPTQESVMFGSNPILAIDMKESIDLTYPYGRRPRLRLPGLLLSMSFADVVTAISQYKEVRIFGNESGLVK